MDEIFDVMIIGAGAAGLTAGIYTSRGKLSTLILNEGAVGGQMVLTNEVANYPGVEKTTGYHIASVMKKQAKEFGCKIKSNLKIAEYHLTEPVKKVKLADGREFMAYSVILAPGGRPRSLNIPGEDKFKGTGISYCATCDGEFFTDKEIVVVGGGNSALEEAVALTKYATKVTVVHQFDQFQAFEYAVEEAKSNPRIEFVMESTLTAFRGNQKLEAVTIKNLKTGETFDYEVQGSFIFIGYLPNTENFSGLVDMNNAGEIIVTPAMHTNVEGVFAAGDSIVKKYRQITTAVADGTIAALSAAEYVAGIKKKLPEALLDPVV